MLEGGEAELTGDTWVVETVVVPAVVPVTLGAVVSGRAVVWPLVVVCGETVGIRVVHEVVPVVVGSARAVVLTLIVDCGVIVGIPVAPAVVSVTLGASVSVRAVVAAPVVMIVLSFIVVGVSMVGSLDVVVSCIVVVSFGAAWVPTVSPASVNVTSRSGVVFVTYEVPIVSGRVPVAFEVVYVGVVVSSVMFVACVVAGGVRVSSVAADSVGVAVVLCSIVTVIFSCIALSVDVTTSVLVCISSVLISVEGVELASVSGSGIRETFITGGKGMACVSSTPVISLPTDGPPAAPLPT